MSSDLEGRGGDFSERDISQSLPRKIGIVGAGRGGMALLRVLQDVQDITVVGICDIDPEAPGLKEAGDRGVNTYSSAEALMSAQQMDWVINVSHDMMAVRLLFSESVTDVKVIDGDVGELIWRILVAFDKDIEDAADISLERASALRTLAWKVVSETVGIVQQTHNRLVNIALRDQLTNLYTRRLLMEFLDKEIGGAFRSGQPLSVALLDLDYFKAVNDQFGHEAGDDILRRFARLLDASGRGGDLMARYGGEEFAMVLPGSHLDDAMACAERLRSRVEQELTRPGGEPQTVSIGVVTFEPTGRPAIGTLEKLVVATRRQLLNSADQALYLAKDAGRNCVMAHSR